MSNDPLLDLEYDEPPSKWLEQCLWQASPAAIAEAADTLGEPVSPEFLNRCAGAAKLGLQLARLRIAVPASHASLLPVVEYLQQLARSVSVTVAPIAIWAGLDKPPTTFSFANGWARLACALGLDRSEALSRLRMSFLSVTQPDLLPMSAALRGAASGRLSLSNQVDSHLTEAIACLAPAQQAELDRLELDLCRVFEATSRF